MRNTLTTIAFFHYELGFIGYDEFQERIQVATWLCDESNGTVGDPRADREEESNHTDQGELDDKDESESVVATIKDRGTNSKDNDVNWIEFVCLNVWIFTKSDPDSYPSYCQKWCFSL